MEIITIDSSDDEEDVPTTAAIAGVVGTAASRTSKLSHGSRIITPRECDLRSSLSDNDSDSVEIESCSAASSSSSSSGSSHDSVWDRVDQIPAMRRRADKMLLLDLGEYGGDVENECHNESSSSKDDLCIDIAAELSHLSLSDDDDDDDNDDESSNISSDNSIFNKVGFISSKPNKNHSNNTGGGDILRDITNHQKEKQSSAGVELRYSNSINVIDTTGWFNTDKSLDDSAQHLEIDDGDSSSSDASLNDSIWNCEIGFQVTRQIKDIATTTATAHGNNDSDSTKNSTGCDAARAQHVIDDDDSSISSAAMLEYDTGFEQSKKKGAKRVESYYDFYRTKQKKGGGKKGVEKSTNNVSEQVHTQKERSDNAYTDGRDSTVQSSKIDASLSLPPEVPVSTLGTWRIVLLMDHREFGCKSNFLETVETHINKHFGGKYAEITTLPSADYLYVARLIMNGTEDTVLDERVLDMVIERKNVADACSCLIAESKKYRPLSFFEAQMYKLQNSGVTKKLFLMEGDEHKTKGMLTGAKGQGEKERRLKRVKTLRMQLQNGEFQGVEFLNTRHKFDTIKYLMHQLHIHQQEFNPRRPPTKTREELKLYINEQMKAPTFEEYLRLRKIPGIGDVKAMKVIMDPDNNWDKSFISPSSSKRSKAGLEDRATFWKAPTNLTYVKISSATANKTKDTPPSRTSSSKNTTEKKTAKATRTKSKDGSSIGKITDGNNTSVKSTEKRHETKSKKLDSFWGHKKSTKSPISTES